LGQVIVESISFALNLYQKRLTIRHGQTTSLYLLDPKDARLTGY
jgi:hypothetical protein